MATYRIIGHDTGEPTLDAFDPYRYLNVGDEFTTTLDDETEYLLTDAGLIELVVPDSAQSGSVIVVDAGTDLDTGRPSGAAAVYWMFDSGVDVGASGANITNVVAGDLIFVADA